MGSSDDRSAISGIGLVLAVLAALAVGGKLFKRQPEIVGHDAPEVALSLVANGADVGGDGTSLSVQQLRGHPVLFDFWATWCRYCRAEAPKVDALSRKWHDRGLVVLGVSTDRADEGDPAAFAR